MDVSDVKTIRWLAFVKHMGDAWHLGYGIAEFHPAGVLVLTTGGWSENEQALTDADPIGASLFWWSSHRGGVHVYCNSSDEARALAERLSPRPA